MSYFITLPLQSASLGSEPTLNQSLLWSVVVIGDDVLIRKNVIIGDNVSVGDNTTIRMDVIVLDGIAIGSDVQIGIGALIQGNVPDGTIVPARSVWP